MNSTNGENPLGANQPIHVIAAETTFPIKSEELLEFVKAQVKEHAGFPLLIAFSELPMGVSPKSRIEGKEFVRKINAELAKHGNAFVFLTIAEKSVGSKRDFITNTGYAITPYTEKGMQYEVSPKLSFWRHGQNINLTNLDSSMLMRYRGTHADNQVVDLVQNWAALSERWRKIKNARGKPFFPQAEISGKLFQMRICADVSSASKNKENLSQDRSVTRGSKKINWIIVPAKGVGEHSIKSHYLPHAREGVLFVDSIVGTSFRILRKKNKFDLKHYPVFLGFSKVGRLRIKQRNSSRGFVASGSVLKTNILNKNNMLNKNSISGPNSQIKSIQLRRK
jgi:hypothetical protein